MSSNTEFHLPKLRSKPKAIAASHLFAIITYFILILSSNYSHVARAFVLNLEYRPRSPNRKKMCWPASSHKITQA